MTEAPKPFSPAEFILQQRKQLEQSYLVIPEEIPDPIKDDVREFVFDKIVDKIKSRETKPVKRTIEVKKEHEGRTGYLPRLEVKGIFKGLLRGKRVTPMKVDEVEESIEVEDIGPPVERVEINVMLDATPTMLRDPSAIHKMMDTIIELTGITPGSLNAAQRRVNHSLNT